MVILGQRWAEAYMKANSGTTIQVTGGGSGTGIAALINGSTDICEASRPMKDKEKEDVQTRRLRNRSLYLLHHGKGLVSHAPMLSEPK